VFNEISFHDDYFKIDLLLYKGIIIHCLQQNV